MKRHDNERNESQIDAYLARAEKWREEMTLLRKILLSLPLTEELKWGKPCYTFQDKNVVLVMGFKNYCSLLFAKGALLKDPKGLLIKAGENTQAARQMRFTEMRQVVDRNAFVKAYLEEAIAAEKAGLEVTYKKITEHKMPEELQKKLAKDGALKKAFAALTPGRQRAYYIHFSSAKQPATREARIEKCRALILAGKGLNDDYLSKKK
jgi:uncharacterized protein YdeI (YjbR/CyaY-like superfamily)